MKLKCWPFKLGLAVTAYLHVKWHLLHVFPQHSATKIAVQLIFVTSVMRPSSIGGFIAGIQYWSRDHLEEKAACIFHAICKEIVFMKRYLFKHENFTMFRSYIPLTVLTCCSWFCNWAVHCGLVSDFRFVLEWWPHTVNLKQQSLLLSSGENAICSLKQQHLQFGLLKAFNSGK